MAQEIKITAGPHSADRDHTEMTGGTMTLLKTIESSELFSLSHYLLPAVETSVPNLDAGLHTLEHSLAYSKNTGSLRSEIAEITGDPDLASCIIDVSPFRISEGKFAFRVTSVIPLDTEVLTTAYAHSLNTAQVYFENGGAAPFSTAKQCGQYDLHDTAAALSIIKSARSSLLNGETAQPLPIERPTSSSITVADLRLVKPKADGHHSQRTLRPDASYVISQVLEEFAHLGLPAVNENCLAFGTYGCMTGDYTMMIGTPIDATHVAIARTLMQLARLAKKEEQSMRFIGEDAKFCLSHIQRNAPEIYQQAMDLGDLGFDPVDATSNDSVGEVRRRPRTA